jgi:hypothetical protein
MQQRGGCSGRYDAQEGAGRLFGLCQRHDVDAAIALPAGFIVFLADGTFLAVTDDVELRRGDAHPDEIILCGGGTPVAEADVVLGGAALVAVALDGQLVIGVVLQDVTQFGGIGLEGFHGIGTERSLVVIEIGVFDFGQKLGPYPQWLRWCRRKVLSVVLSVRTTDVVGVVWILAGMPNRTSRLQVYTPTVRRDDTGAFGNRLDCR